MENATIYVQVPRNSATPIGTVDAKAKSLSGKLCGRTTTGQGKPIIAAYQIPNGNKPNRQLQFRRWVRAQKSIKIHNATGVGYGA